MENINTDKIIKYMTENEDACEEILYWLNDNGYLNDYKMQQNTNYDE